MLVLDASAAVGMVRDGADGPALKYFVESGQKAIAPEFFNIEVAQVAWKYAHVGALDAEGALEMMRAVVGCVDEFVDDSSLAAEAFAEALRLDHSFYDMLYVALARRTASALLTCDRRLAELCVRNGVECIHLADLTPLDSARNHARSRLICPPCLQGILHNL